MKYFIFVFTHVVASHPPTSVHTSLTPKPTGTPQIQIHTTPTTTTTRKQRTTNMHLFRRERPHLNCAHPGKDMFRDAAAIQLQKGE